VTTRARISHAFHPHFERSSWSARLRLAPVRFGSFVQDRLVRVWVVYLLLLRAPLLSCHTGGTLTQFGHADDAQDVLLSYDAAVNVYYLRSLPARLHLPQRKAHATLTDLGDAEGADHIAVDEEARAAGEARNCSWSILVNAFLHVERGGCKVQVHSGGVYTAH
jgi:hypothetical protein